MQAQVRLIDCHSHNMRRTIELVYNRPQVNVISPPRSNGKYKKVTLQARLALQALVRQGSSIIDAARKLNINYSTAKSIFQNIKARAQGKYKRKRYVPTDSEEEEAKLTTFYGRA